MEIEKNLESRSEREEHCQQDLEEETASGHLQIHEYVVHLWTFTTMMTVRHKKRTLQTSRVQQKRWHLRLELLM